MIRIELSTLVFVYLFVLLAALFSLWIAYAWGRIRREKQALRYRVRCTICATIFDDRTDVALPRCPRCGSLNERHPLGGL